MRRALWIVLVVAACRADPVGVDGQLSVSSSESELGARAVLELPADWRTSSPYGFELSVAGWPPGEAGRLSDADLAALAQALAGQDETAVRAAVLLARSADPRAGQTLLERLEERLPAPERHGDAAEVVAAAALWDWTVAPDQGQRLAALADGEPPHPDLEVRVECAASALNAGRAEVVPFLLRVLRAGTPAERRDPPDWPATRTLAWAKSRAAEALARRAAEEPAFRPDGSYAHQMEEADRLEALLRDR